MKAKSKNDYWKEFRGSRDQFEACWLRVSALLHLDLIEDHDTGIWLEIFAGKTVNDEDSRFWIHG